MTKRPQITFRKIDSPAEVTDYIARVIKDHLIARERVLWLVSGGSTINLEVVIAQHLLGVQLDGLSVTLADERYGPVDHKDSNWYQLEQAGFSFPGARIYEVLKGKEIEPTSKEFDHWLKPTYKMADFKIALLGMGADGHTSGILPGSPALNSSRLACSYRTPDFQRITTTALALSQLDEAVLYAVGTEKWPQLERLQTDVSPSVQPAQLLKQIPKSTVFNDYLGDRL